MKEQPLFLSDDLAFYTIEGEGKFAGYPSVFVRLSGCNLTCQGFKSKDSPHGCDSFTSWKVFNKYTPDELNDLLESEHLVDPLKNGAILKITGGEPLLQQKKIIHWINSFILRFGFVPQIDFETNGTLQPHETYWDEVAATFTVSPKLSNNGDPEEKRYKPDVLKWHKEKNSCIKFVVSGIKDIYEIEEKYIKPGLVKPGNVWIMPCCGSRTEHNANAPLVAELCKKYNFKFSPRLQLVIWDKALKV